MVVKILRGNPLPALPRVTRRTTYFTAVSRLFPLRQNLNPGQATTCTTHTHTHTHTIYTRQLCADRKLSIRRGSS